MIQFPYPMPFPGPQPLPGPYPFPVPQPGPGGGTTDVPAPGETSVTDTIGPDANVTGQVGAVGTTGAAPASPGGSAVAGPAPSGDWKKFLVWIAALAALWLILTAAQDAGYPQFANGIAGLVLFGSILAMGPKAIDNAKLIFQ